MSTRGGGGGSRESANTLTLESVASIVGTKGQEQVRFVVLSLHKSRKPLLLKSMAEIATYYSQTLNAALQGDWLHIAGLVRKCCGNSAQTKRFLFATAVDKWGSS